MQGLVRTTQNFIITVHFMLVLSRGLKCMQVNEKGVSDLMKATCGDKFLTLNHDKVSF